MNRKSIVQLTIVMVILILLGAEAQRLVTLRAGQPTRRPAQAAPQWKFGGPPRDQQLATLGQWDRSRKYEIARLEPMDGVTGAGLELQRRVAQVFSQSDPVPATRLQHFAWLEASPVWIRGWRGSIREIEPSPAGGWLVRVRISPVLASDVGSVHASDYWDEVYRFSNEGLQFVQGVNEPLSTPRVVTYQ